MFIKTFENDPRKRQLDLPWFTGVLAIVTKVGFLVSGTTCVCSANNTNPLRGLLVGLPVFAHHAPQHAPRREPYMGTLSNINSPEMRYQLWRKTCAASHVIFLFLFLPNYPRRVLVCLRPIPPWCGGISRGSRPPEQSVALRAPD